MAGAVASLCGLEMAEAVASLCSVEMAGVMCSLWLWVALVSLLSIVGMAGAELTNNRRNIFVRGKRLFDKSFDERTTHLYITGTLFNGKNRL